MCIGERYNKFNASKDFYTDKNIFLSVLLTKLIKLYIIGLVIKLILCKGGIYIMTSEDFSEILSYLKCKEVSRRQALMLMKYFPSAYKHTYCHGTIYRVSQEDVWNYVKINYQNVISTRKIRGINDLLSCSQAWFEKNSNYFQTY